MSTICRIPWTEFHPVWIHAEEVIVKKHLAYHSAKGGEPDAAFQLVNDLLSETTVRRLQEAFQYVEPILVSVHAIENAGVNAIPEALADILAEQLNWRTENAIVQTNIVGHTGANGFARLARQATFDGPVDQNDVYILVDDFVGQGGTLANLRSHVILAGGRVVGATVLTGKPYSAHLALTAETLKALRLKHGQKLENWWQQWFGFGFECLTESEARYLLNTPNADRVRNKIIEAIED